MDIKNFNNSYLLINCLQETSTPGIRLNNILFPRGEYIFTIDVEKQNEQIILWIQNVKTKSDNRFYLSEGISNLTISFSEDVNANIGILFVSPTLKSKFVFKNIVVKKKEQVIISIEKQKPTNILESIDHTYVINLDNRKDRLFKVGRYLK